VVCTSVTCFLINTQILKWRIRIAHTCHSYSSFEYLNAYRKSRINPTQLIGKTQPRPALLWGGFYAVYVNHRKLTLSIWPSSGYWSSILFSCRISVGRIRPSLKSSTTEHTSNVFIQYSRGRVALYPLEDIATYLSRSQTQSCSRDSCLVSRQPRGTCLPVLISALLRQTSASVLPESQTKCLGLNSASLLLVRPRLGLKVSASVLLEAHELVVVRPKPTFQ